MKEPKPPILNYADGRPEKWIPIAQFPDEFTAHLASGKLDAEGIPTNLGNELNSITGTNPTTLAVRSEDAHDAIAILKNTPAKQWLIGP